MARTQALDYDKRRKAIMSTAARLYAQRGFLGTSVAQIAVACRVSKSLLYHYYPSKEDILFDVMDSHVQSLVQSAKELGRKSGSAAETVRHLAEELMNLYMDAQDHQKVLLNELVNLPGGRRKLIIEHQHQLLDIVDELVLKLRPDLSKRRPERRAIGMLFFGMLNWTHTWFNPSGPVKHAQFAHMVSDTFLAGVEAYVRQ
jgi:AcrR family transcriptional regulator